MQSIYQKADKLHTTMEKAEDTLKELYKKHHVIDESHYNELRQCITRVVVECIVIKHDYRPF